MRVETRYTLFSILGLAALISCSDESNSPSAPSATTRDAPPLVLPGQGGDIVRKGSGSVAEWHPPPDSRSPGIRRSGIKDV